MWTTRANFCEVHPEKALLATVYCYDFDKEYWDYMDQTGRFEPNPSLDRVYQVLCKLGYRMSGEEKALQDGSHELYIPQEE